jgi:hypothetical protein
VAQQACHYVIRCIRLSPELLVAHASNRTKLVKITICDWPRSIPSTIGRVTLLRFEADLVFASF